MAILQIPTEPDEGLFYVRVWRGDDMTETMHTSLQAASTAVDLVYAEGKYTRVEFLQAREWGTRTKTPTDQKT